MIGFRNYRQIDFSVPINEMGFEGMEIFTDRTFSGQEYTLVFNVEYFGGRETYIQIGKITNRYTITPEPIMGK